MEQTDDSRVEETKIQRLLKNSKVKDKVTGKEALRLSPHFLFRDFASGALKRSVLHKLLTFLIIWFIIPM